MDFNTVIALFGAAATVLAGVVTMVWVVAQIKEQTSNLSVQIKHLADEISSIRDGHKDHEERIRAIEFQHRSRHGYED